MEANNGKVHGDLILANNGKNGLKTRTLQPVADHTARPSFLCGVGGVGIGV